MYVLKNKVVPIHYMEVQRKKNEFINTQETVRSDDFLKTLRAVNTSYNKCRSKKQTLLVNISVTTHCHCNKLNISHLSIFLFWQCIIVLTKKEKKNLEMREEEKTNFCFVF